MKKMLKQENVQIVDSAKDWIEAIHVGVQPLIDTGYVEPRYSDSIIANTEKFGPYYVLCEDLALLHARPDQGVIENQIAVTLLKHPIRFKEGGLKVRLLVALAAIDSESHLETMKAISNIFNEPEQISKLVHAKTTKEIYDRFIAAAK